jgi:hypothetical protein
MVISFWEPVYFNPTVVKYENNNINMSEMRNKTYMIPVPDSGIALHSLACAAPSLHSVESASPRESGSQRLRRSRTGRSKC